MVWKIVVLGIVLLAAWGLMFRKPPRVRRAPRTPMRAHDLIKCTKCGMYLPANKPCDCSDRA